MNVLFLHYPVTPNVIKRAPLSSSTVMSKSGFEFTTAAFKKVTRDKTEYPQHPLERVPPYQPPFHP